MIIKDKIKMFMKGHPTVSDKYNVSGGILAGSTPVKFGELVKHSSTAGYFEAASDGTTLAGIGGFALATNVKLAEDFPGQTVQINPGEAFNLLINGFIAVELDDNASIETLTAIAAVGAASEDSAVVQGKTYYTRSSNSDGAGYLNDGTYKYAKVTSPTGNPSTSSYYELSVLGRDASTDKVIPNAEVCVILANGKLTTVDKYDSGTIEKLPSVVFTGLKEIQGDKILAEIYVK